MPIGPPSNFWRTPMKPTKGGIDEVKGKMSISTLLAAAELLEKQDGESVSDEKKPRLLMYDRVITQNAITGQHSARVQPDGSLVFAPRHRFPPLRERLKSRVRIVGGLASPDDPLNLGVSPRGRRDSNPQRLLPAPQEPPQREPREKWSPWVVPTPVLLSPGSSRSPSSSSAKSQGRRKSKTRATGGGKVYKRPHPMDGKPCSHCGNLEKTPEWRSGPYGFTRKICNACGLFFRKLKKKFSVREANLFMQYRLSQGGKNRRVPCTIEVPADFIKQLENNPSITGNYETRGEV
ncbi:GATA-type transcription factor KNAG_0M01200 [Huiozyma naganishii CBS 8797]|uniref:GATA-type domain-containing protein n=1 Tax=Huiozyma naganishii (strain ATCC MYA-139 / BCRC 22969 / CBS 8797 / KCTC 17520 / NBRC 10181 / NCYC 3082 / Yp74L-3) TaxID=1071383 RepID=J7RSU5_HUIN7|nr:hypothetical protein KNAG_0M01200 [Kazachstania naganishii CBS 8797]CCK72973.1 hypothetical protein KNAG_0M01200 [Kazachstania naganishii CBS 8797]